MFLVLTKTTRWISCRLSLKQTYLLKTESHSCIDQSINQSLNHAMADIINTFVFAFISLWFFNQVFLPGLHWHWQTHPHVNQSFQASISALRKPLLPSQRIRLQLEQAVLHLPQRLSSTWCDLSTLCHKTRCECRHLHWPGQPSPLPHMAGPHSCLPFAGKKLSPNVLFLLYGTKKHFQPGIWHVSNESLLDVEGGSVAAKLAARRRNSSKHSLCLPAPPSFLPIILLSTPFLPKWKPAEAIGRARQAVKTKCRLGGTERHIHEPLSEREREGEGATERASCRE